MLRPSLVFLMKAISCFSAPIILAARARVSSIWGCQVWVSRPWFWMSWAKSIRAWAAGRGQGGDAGVVVEVPGL